MNSLATMKIRYRPSRLRYRIQGYAVFVGSFLGTLGLIWGALAIYTSIK